MEQKKILWVVLLMSAFVVVIFSLAIYLYAPFRNKSSASASDISYLGQIKNDDIKDIDPVKWSREPDSIPKLESDKTPSLNIVNNLTVVNGEPQEQENNEKENQIVNVEGLVDNKDAEKPIASLPENLAEQFNKNKKTDDVKNEQVNSNESAKKVEVEKSALPKLAKQPVLTEKPVNKSDKTGAANNLNTKSDTKKQNTNSVSTQKKTVEIIYWIQTASLSSKLNAEQARETLTSKYMNAEIFTKETSNGLTHRVRVGPFKNKTEAEYWLKKVKEIRGFENSYISQDRKKL